MREALFVYGTLRPDQRNWHVIEDLIEEWTSGYINGYALWRLPEGYPGLRPSNGGRVFGTLVFGRTGSPLLQRTDRLEGFDPDLPDDPKNLFHRVRTSAYSSGHDEVQAWIYVYHRHHDEYIRSAGVLIQGGDWIKSQT